MRVRLAGRRHPVHYGCGRPILGPEVALRVVDSAIARNSSVSGARLRGAGLTEHDLAIMVLAVARRNLAATTHLFPPFVG